MPMDTAHVALSTMLPCLSSMVSAVIALQVRELTSMRLGIDMLGRTADPVIGHGEAGEHRAAQRPDLQFPAIDGMAFQHAAEIHGGGGDQRGVEQHAVDGQAARTADIALGMDVSGKVDVVADDIAGGFEPASPANMPHVDVSRTMDGAVVDDQAVAGDGFGFHHAGDQGGAESNPFGEPGMSIHADRLVCSAFYDFKISGVQVQSPLPFLVVGRSPPAKSYANVCNSSKNRR